MINLPISLFAASCKSSNFFGLKPWYYYLPDSDFKGCEIKNFTILPPRSGSGNPPSDVPLVLLAIVDDLLRIAGMVAVAFVIVGAIQYIKGQGSPDESAKAQSTIVNALIGLAVSITAVAFISFLGARIGG